MPENDLVDRIMAFVEKYPDIDKEIIRDALLIRKQFRKANMMIETYLANIGLSTTQIETLEAVFYQPAQFLTPAELAEVVLLTRSAMTGNLDSLQRKGCISRKPHPKDRRKIAVSLTRKGQVLCEKQLPERYREISRIVGSLSPNERRLFLDTYQKILKVLGEMLEEAGL